MDIILTVLGVVFVTLLLIAAFTLGSALLMFFLAVAFTTALLIQLREFWRRWRFMRGADVRPRGQKVIEGDYKDVTPHDMEEK